MPESYSSKFRRGFGYPRISRILHLSLPPLPLGCEWSTLKLKGVSQTPCCTLCQPMPWPSNPCFLDLLARFLWCAFFFKEFWVFFDRDSTPCFFWGDGSLLLSSSSSLLLFTKPARTGWPGKCFLVAMPLNLGGESSSSEKNSVGMGCELCLTLLTGQGSRHAE